MNGDFYDAGTEARLARELAFIKCDRCGFGINIGALQHCTECEPINIIKRLQAERAENAEAVDKWRSLFIELNDRVDRFVGQLSGWTSVNQTQPAEIVDDVMKKRRRDR